MYRDDNEALSAQCDALRRELRRAAGDAERERQLRAELEASVAQLEAAGISEAKREAAKSSVQTRALLFGALAGVMAFSAIGIAAFRIVRVAHEEPQAALVDTRDPELQWFSDVRARCNPVEVSVALRAKPAPATSKGRSYVAVCLALAHQVDRAADVIASLPAAERRKAAATMFSIIHPVADAGDDVAAGPTMELVVRHQPENFMALFHAGIAAHETGRPDDAEDYLRRFLKLYNARDTWTSRARAALKEIARTRAVESGH